MAWRLDGAWTAPIHYRNQCWDIVNQNLRNNLQWNFNRNSRSRRDVMRLSNKRSPYLFGVATANRTKVTTPNKYGAEIIARMSDWENSYISIHENAFENVVWEMAAILSRPQCVKEWALCVIQDMINALSSVVCKSMVSRLRSFAWRVGVHQGSVLSPLRSILVLDMLLHEFCTGAPLYCGRGSVPELASGR